jgi:hypothetical protein
MASEANKQAIDGVSAYLSAHPEEARYRDGTAIATLRGGLVVDVAGRDGEAITTDMVAAVGGGGDADHGNSPALITEIPQVTRPGRLGV